MTASTIAPVTYTARPAVGGGFTLSNETGFSTFCKTLKFARSYVEFGGNTLIVLDKNGNVKN